MCSTLQKTEIIDVIKKEFISIRTALKGKGGNDDLEDSDEDIAQDNPATEVRRMEFLLCLCRTSCFVSHCIFVLVGCWRSPWASTHR